MSKTWGYSISGTGGTSWTGTVQAETGPDAIREALADQFGDNWKDGEANDPYTRLTSWFGGTEDCESILKEIPEGCQSYGFGMGEYDYTVDVSESLTAVQAGLPTPGTEILAAPRVFGGMLIRIERILPKAEITPSPMQIGAIQVGDLLVTVERSVEKPPTGPITVMVPVLVSQDELALLRRTKSHEFAEVANDVLLDKNLAGPFILAVRQLAELPAVEPSESEQVMTIMRETNGNPEERERRLNELAMNRPKKR